MAISYNKALVGAGSLIGMALAGGVLLGLGMAGSHLGIWGGHTWQIATGSGMLGIGVIGGVTTLIYLHKSRDVDLATDALQKDPRKEIWTYANWGGQEIKIMKNKLERL